MRYKPAIKQYRLMKKLIYLLPVFVPFSCSTDHGQDLPDPQPSSAMSIKSVDYNQDAVQFTVVSAVPQPCYRPHSSEVDRVSEIISIKIYVQRTTNDPCLDVMSSVESKISIPAVSGNTYKFQFWRYEEEAPLDTTLTMP